MSTNPIDIIAAAIRRAGGRLHVGTDPLVRVVTETIATDPRFVANAVEALKADGWEETPEGPMGMYQMSDQDLTNIAVAVLRSVGGGA